MLNILEKNITEFVCTKYNALCVHYIMIEHRLNFTLGKW